MYSSVSACLFSPVLVDLSNHTQVFSICNHDTGVWGALRIFTRKYIQVRMHTCTGTKQNLNIENILVHWSVAQADSKDEKKLEEGPFSMFSMLF